MLMVLLSHVACLGPSIGKEGKETYLRERIQGGGSGKFDSLSTRGGLLEEQIAYKMKTD